jgi:hypothetical protein
MIYEYLPVIGLGSASVARIPGLTANAVVIGVEAVRVAADDTEIGGVDLVAVEVGGADGDAQSRVGGVALGLRGVGNVPNPVCRAALRAEHRGKETESDEPENRPPHDPVGLSAKAGEDLMRS